MSDDSSSVIKIEINLKNSNEPDIQIDELSSVAHIKPKETRA